MRYPNIETIGLKIVNDPSLFDGNEFVKWKEIIKVLGQWRYGLSYRTRFARTTKVGIEASDLENALKEMARSNKKFWPSIWVPKKQ